ncbi:hypothetical protein ACLOJK_014926 [Asimina triloba]
MCSCPIQATQNDEDDVLNPIPLSSSSINTHIANKSKTHLLQRPPAHQQHASLFQGDDNERHPFRPRQQQSPATASPWPYTPIHLARSQLQIQIPRPCRTQQLTPTIAFDDYSSYRRQQIHRPSNPATLTTSSRPPPVCSQQPTSFIRSDASTATSITAPPSRHRTAAHHLGNSKDAPNNRPSSSSNDPTRPACITPFCSISTRAGSNASVRRATHRQHHSIAHANSPSFQ